VGVGAEVGVEAVVGARQDVAMAIVCGEFLHWSKDTTKQ
jgi:hypothetical protein